MNFRAVASHEVGAPLLRKAIIIEGVLSIQAGENPLIVAERLYCYLGEDVLASVKDKPAQAEGNEVPELERTAQKFGKILAAMREAEEAVDLSRISDETLANLFLFIEPKLAARVVSSLSSERQAKIVKLLDADDKQDINIAYELKDILDDNLVFGQVKRMSRTKRVALIVEIMNMVSRQTEFDIMKRLEDEAAELAEEIRRQMFVFDDLWILDGRAVQRVMRDITDGDLARALKNASEEVRDLFFDNMSPRIAALVKTDMESLPARAEEIEEAQQRIINTVRKLEDRGEIVISRGGI
jgi:flagellar motor switch protein FliG